MNYRTWYHHTCLEKRTVQFVESKNLKEKPTGALGFW